MALGGLENAHFIAKNGSRVIAIGCICIMIKTNNISLIGLLLRGWAVAAAVWAVINQIRDCITVDTIHYIAMYIPDSFNFDTVLSFKVYRAYNCSVTDL